MHKIISIFIRNVSVMNKKIIYCGTKKSCLCMYVNKFVEFVHSYHMRAWSISLVYIYCIISSTGFMISPTDFSYWLYFCLVPSLILGWCTLQSGIASTSCDPALNNPIFSPPHLLSGRTASFTCVLHAV